MLGRGLEGSSGSRGSSGAYALPLFLKLINGILPGLEPGQGLPHGGGPGERRQVYERDFQEQRLIAGGVAVQEALITSGLLEAGE